MDSLRKTLWRMWTTHFVVNLVNSHTLGFRGDTMVKYAEVVSSGNLMTMVIKISGGRRSMIKTPMLIFTNPSSNYPIRGLEDNIPRVCYWRGPKGWMDQSLFPQFFAKPRSFQVDMYGCKKFIWVDNYTSHNITLNLTTILTTKCSTLKYFLPCSTHLCQLAETFIISKIKDARTKCWEAKKIALIAEGAWQNKARADGQWLGKFTNPGKRFFLLLAADSVEDVNRELDFDNMSYTRKAMICLGMALALHGTWSVQQLFPHLHLIVAKHEAIFKGRLYQPNCVI